MKTKVIAISMLLLSVLLLIAQTPIKYAAFTKTVADTGTPEAITSTNLRCASVTILGVNGIRTNNTGTVYIGWTSGNNTQFFPVTSGGEIVITAGENRTINLADIYVDVLNNGDGVGVYYK